MKMYLCLFFLLFRFLEAAHPAIIKEEFVFEQAPFPSCHAATLTQAPTGDILCAWFAGTEEGSEDVAIWLSHRTDQWTAPEKVAEAKGTPCWNPVLFTLPTHEILLFYKVGKNPLAWSGMLKRSQDGGVHWSQDELLPAGVLGPIKNKPLLIGKHRLLCGSSKESWKRWGCWVERTEDAGKTWHMSNPINLDAQLFGIIQPTLFFSGKGTLRMLARSHQVGFICTATSKDKGLSWSSATPTALPNPNSGIDAVNLHDGRVLLVYNHSTTERFPLNVALSSDGGETWSEGLTLEEMPGEYSYPSVIQSKDGQVHVAYTWNREKIKYVILDPKKF